MGAVTARVRTSIKAKKRAAPRRIVNGAPWKWLLPSPLLVLLLLLLLPLLLLLLPVVLPRL
jgi:hypothetical protein